ncbi:G-patch domain and KOW motifs-containing protein-like [Penaeus monodon]|uniref:G-patch domain and KOW motifs-containing protein-like n=1 Tax=Penaeus monodon TaxID=6687 RepID=UPI0018A7DCC0|nr:G-patch domain and KOW motifs-containing protein-like [Penaeus monodon]
MSAPKFSLSFSRKIEKKTLQPSAIRNDAPAEVREKTENLESIEENVLKTDGKAEEEELVIPMVQVDRAEIFRKLAEKKLEEDGNNAEDKEKGKDEEQAKDKVEAKTLTLDEQAEAALIEESKRRLEGWTERAAPSNLTIPVAEKEAENGAELYPVGKESSLDNYEEVEVDNFGAALLRGMGWKKTQGIGKRNKKVVDIIDPSAKTFGLMGSSLTGAKDGESKAAAEEEELSLQKGSYVFIHSGRQRGTYGIVESLDEDHMLVKAAVSQAILREVELNVRVVSQREFKDSSRVINKEMYDKYKEEEERKKGLKKNKHSDDNESSDSKDSRRSKQPESRKTAKEESIKREDAKEVKKEGESMEKEKAADKERDYAAKEKEKPDRRRDEDKSTGNYSKGSRYREDEEKDSKYRGKDFKESKYKDEREDKYREKYEKERYRQEDNRKYRERDEKPERSRESDNSKYSDEKGSSYKGNIGRENRYRENDEQVKKYRESKEHRDKDGGYDSKYKSKYEDSKARYKDEYIKNKYMSADLSASQKKRSKDDDCNYEAKKVKRSPERMPMVPWVRENLRVRLISKDYKGGKYHKEKVIVKTVITAESCECITPDGDVLRKVHPEWLETVIPKIPPQIIMVVKGQQKGQRGRILQLHKDQEKASVQFLEDETVIMKFHYDDICEYVS